MSDLDDLKARLRKFTAEREWERFHDPKNLAMAVASEAGELLSELRWLSSDEASRAQLSTDKVEAIRLEIADVFIFLIRLSDVLEIDLMQAAFDKIALNQARFPTDATTDYS